METNWKEYLPHSPWSGVCCNVFMDNFSNSAPERPPSFFAYQHLTDLSFCTEAAQSSLNISNFYHQSRLSLSSCTSHHPYFPSCCPNSSNDSAFRPITLPTLPEPRPFWYPPHLDSYSGHFGNGLYRFLPSASQSSLTPLSPAPDYVPFFGNTSLLSHYSPTSSKNSGLSCSPDPSRLSSSSLSSTTISPAEPLTIRVKSEPFGTFSSHSIQSMTPEMSPQNSVKSEADLCRSSSIFSRTLDNNEALKHSALNPAFSKSNETNETTQDCLSKNSRENKTFRKFGAKVKPLQKDEKNFYASTKSDSKSEQNQSLNQNVESSIEVISKNDTQNLLSNSLRSSSKPLDTAIEVIPCAITSKVESSMRRNSYLDSHKSSCSSDSLLSSESTNSVKSKSSTLLSPVGPHSSKLSKSIYSSSSSSSLSSPLSNSSSDNLSSSVPIGIAVARKRQSSLTKYNDDINKLSSQKVLPSDSSESIKKVIKMSNEGTEIKPDSSLHINTAAVTITPDYRLARDDLTGQFFLFPNTSNYFPSQLTSVITNPALSIQTMPPLNQSNTLTPESNFLTITNQYPPSSNLSEEVPISTVAEQAIQACMSDEESDHLVINENSDTNVSNKVTSACQVDMDLEMKDETKSLDDDTTTTTTTTTIKQPSDVKLTDQSVLFDETEDEKIPTLPVDSKEVINFINVRGFDLLVDSVERANTNEDEPKDKTSAPTEDTNCDKSKKKFTLEVDLVDHTPSSFTDGLKLLSALAEQRAMEEEENIQDCKRRHSTDCPSAKEASNTESKQNKAGAKRKQRSESSSGYLHSSQKSTSEEIKSESPSTPSCPKKRKKDNTDFNPWTIRRSERIFLHEAFQQATTSSNQQDTKLKESVPNTKKANNDITAKKNVNKSENVKTNELVTKDEDENVFKLTKKDLKNDLRVLLKKDDLLYAGSLNTIEPPDIYGINLDGQRNLNRNVYSREDLLKEVIKEVKPSTISELCEGKRVCAYWSQQYKCLYSGTVARCSSPQHQTKKNLVFIEFDDGDNSKINLENIRLLPQNFPIQKINNKSQKDKQALKHSLVTKNSVKKGDKVCSKKEKSKVAYDKSLSCEGEEKVEDKEDEETEEDNEEETKNEEEKETVRRKCKLKAKSLLKKVATKTTKKVVKVNEKPNHGNKRTQNKREAKVQDDQVKSNHSKTESKEDSKEKLVKRDKNVAATRDSASSKTKLINFEKSKTVERQLWQWSGTYVKKHKAKKILYKEIKRGKEVIKIGDCAVFLSTGRPHLPYVGRIDSMWQTGNANMTVKVKWFYHPEETKTQPALVDPQGALFESYHFDQNDVQTISHKCLVLSWPEYQKQLKEKLRLTESVDSSKIYYLAGDYEPLSGKMHIVPGIPLHTS